jgi:hypothetical protein
LSSQALPSAAVLAAAVLAVGDGAGALVAGAVTVTVDAPLLVVPGSVEHATNPVTVTIAINADFVAVISVPPGQYR